MKIKWKSIGSSMCGGGKLRKEFIAAGKMGRNYTCSNAHEIKAGYNFNGSGPDAFGGAREWPTAHAKVAFQEGQEKERDAFVEALKDFVSDYFEPKYEGVRLRDLPKWKTRQSRGFSEAMLNDGAGIS